MVATGACVNVGLLGPGGVVLQSKSHHSDA